MGAEPTELPARIQAYVARVRYPDTLGLEDEAAPAAGTTPLQQVFRLLRQRTGHDFSLYKPSTLHRRMERRMVIHGVPSLALYADFLERNVQEVDLLFTELLIGVTSFFRDPAAWKYLAEVALPELLTRRTTEPSLRAWVIGCSTGEEAYSLAMIFSEVVQRLPQPHDFTLQIFASDLSPDAIVTARRGIYPPSISAQVSPDRLTRFFSAHESHYKVNQGIRDMVLFAQHDVVLDPPFTKLDLIALPQPADLLWTPVAAQTVAAASLQPAPRRSAVAGGAETVGQFDSLFVPIEPKLRLYLRKDQVPETGADFVLQSLPPPIPLGCVPPMNITV